MAWIDVNRRVSPVRNASVYERLVIPPGRRIPALAVLDHEGKTLAAVRARNFLADSDSAAREYDRTQALDFLRAWATERSASLAER